ncbi:hypothetical protein DK28_0207905 [Peptococcaceae bacterium SCADC1_2_3]|jgi:DNA-directed RNA polymerase subunit omega|nr:hypothetical protein DK28_0207905 [Peptococcaceae bacterium SCADC1_2_3]KFI36250.1 hypothetical protein HY00_04070 [Peptococcaceae bacterium SCADC1_2_3]
MKEEVSLDELLKKVDSRFTLVAIISKRARMLAEKEAEQSENNTANPVEAALEELAKNKITYRFLKSKKDKGKLC